MKVNLKTRSKMGLGLRDTRMAILMQGSFLKTGQTDKANFTTITQIFIEEHFPTD